MAALVTAAAAFTGCSGLRAEPEQIQYYTLSYQPAQLNDKDPAHPAVVLEVRPFDAAAPYRSRQIVYADNQYRRKTYVYHQWISKPADMLRDLIIRDLRAANFAGAVTGTSKDVQRPTHVLKASIEAFYEDDAQNPWQAVLVLTATLASSPGNGSSPAILLQKTYEARKEMDQNNPMGLVSAMSTAFAGASGQIISDILNSLESS